MAKQKQKTKTVTLVKDGLSLRKACIVVVNYLEPYIIDPHKDYEFVKMDTETGKPVLDENQQPIKYKKKGGILTDEEVDIVLDVWSEFANMNALRKDGPYVSMTRAANRKARKAMETKKVDQTIEEFRDDDAGIDPTPEAEYDEVVGDSKDND